MSARNHVAVFGGSTYFRRQSFLVQCSTAGLPGQRVPETRLCCTPTVSFRHQSVKGLLPSVKHSPESARGDPQWASVPNSPYHDSPGHILPSQSPKTPADVEDKFDAVLPTETWSTEHSPHACLDSPRPDLTMHVSSHPLLAPTVAAEQAAATPYGQCGGVGFTGPMRCGTGYYCTVYK